MDPVNQPTRSMIEVTAGLRVDRRLPAVEPGEHLVGDGRSGAVDVDVAGRRSRRPGRVHGPETAAGAVGDGDLQRSGRGVGRKAGEAGDVHGDRLARCERAVMRRTRLASVEQSGRGDRHEPARLGSGRRNVVALNIGDEIGLHLRVDVDGATGPDRHRHQVGDRLPGAVDVDRRGDRLGDSSREDRDEPHVGGAGDGHVQHHGAGARRNVGECQPERLAGVDSPGKALADTGVEDPVGAHRNVGGGPGWRRVHHRRWCDDREAQADDQQCCSRGDRDQDGRKLS